MDLMLRVVISFKYTCLTYCGNVFSRAVSTDVIYIQYFIVIYYLLFIIYYLLFFIYFLLLLFIKLYFYLFIGLLIYYDFICVLGAHWRAKKFSLNVFFFVFFDLQASLTSNFEIPDNIPNLLDKFIKYDDDTAGVEEEVPLDEAQNDGIKDDAYHLRVHK